MNHRITSLVSHCRRAPGALALLLVLSLNMVALPCAMAFENVGHSCPHCPPDEEQAMAGHHEHSKVASSPCATAGTSCCEIDTASVDARGGQLKVKDIDDSREFLPAPGPSMLSLQRAARFVIGADPPDPPCSYVPRHVLFCVYLD